MASPAVSVGTPNYDSSGHTSGTPYAGNDAGAGGLSVRPMRLKVLYTFDDQNKTNCLARWPHVLHIKAITMDEDSTIGVVELKTCIQAIVQCSPELVARLGQDYTVYAYDYSEYDIPLVGQGMLSWALAAASPTPEAPASQSRQLITGRVCKNIQGLFTNGVAETLEVKLRLVPVPTVLQSEYVSSMEKYRELSKVMPPGFDFNEWFSFLQANPNIAHITSRNNSQSPALSQRNGATMEVVNQLLSPSLQPQNSTDPFNAPSQLDGASRASSPGVPPNSQVNSRPASRNTVKRPRKPRAPRNQPDFNGNTSGYEEGTDGDDPPPAKKRATIQKVNWNAKGAFGKGSQNLRVAASTAGSLRLFRPIAVAPAPGPNNTAHLQEFPRAPTPVPELPALHRERSNSQSHLRRASLVSQGSQEPTQYRSPYPPSETGHALPDNVRLSIESAMTSPEKEDSPADTPPDITSSPPVMRAPSRRSTPPCPSSPLLPPMPRTDHDSGFMSGDISELFEDQDARPAAEGDVPVIAKTTRHSNKPPSGQQSHQGFVIQEVTPGPPELLPTKILPRTIRPKPEPKQKQKQKPRGFGRTNSTMSDSAADFIQGEMACPSPRLDAMTPNFQSFTESQQGTPLPYPHDEQAAVAPKLEPTTSNLSAPTIDPGIAPTDESRAFALPPIPASEPNLPPNYQQNSQIWSDAPHPQTDANGNAVAQPRGYTSGARAKKTNIRIRLEQALAKGEMPPFCSNCGAIDTPTWRRAYSQEHKGDPGYYDYSDAAGKVTAVEITERDDDGKPSAYKIIKKNLGKDEDKNLYAEVLLCNPCGIWISKYKCHRPQDVWRNKEASKERRRDKAPYKSRKSQNGDCPVPTSDAGFHSDAPGPPPGPPAQQNPERNVPQNLYQQNQLTAGQAIHLQQAQRSGSARPSTNSGATADKAANTLLRRAIQSSPARWMGTRQTPIDVEEDDMGATRRLLFPSPRKDGSPKVLGEVEINGAVSPTDFGSHTTIVSKRVVVETSNKENQPPPLTEDDVDENLLKLFEAELTRPKTPDNNKTPRASQFKTPTQKTPVNHRPITRSVSRSAKSLRHQMLPQRTPTKTPSTTRRSPRRAQVLESPFTATLNQIMNEGNTASPSRRLDLGLDLNDLPDMAHQSADLHSDLFVFQNANFGHNADVFSTDFPMPSSPPALGNMFELYEDPLSGMDLQGLDGTSWSDFVIHEQEQSESRGRSLDEAFAVDARGRATFAMPPPKTPKVGTSKGRKAGVERSGVAA